jgi:hypothetical protein
MASTPLGAVIVRPVVVLCRLSTGWTPANRLTVTQPRTRRPGDTVAASVPEAHGQGATT